MASTNCCPRHGRCTFRMPGATLKQWTIVWIELESFKPVCGLIIWFCFAIWFLHNCPQKDNLCSLWYPDSKIWLLRHDARLILCWEFCNIYWGAKTLYGRCRRRRFWNNILAFKVLLRKLATFQAQWRPPSSCRRRWCRLECQVAQWAARRMGLEDFS